MKSIYALAVGKVLVPAAGIFLALAVAGCSDPVVKDFEANRRRMGDECRRHLRSSMAAFTPTNQTPIFYPAP